MPRQSALFHWNHGPVHAPPNIGRRTTQTELESKVGKRLLPAGLLALGAYLSLRAML